MSPRRQRLTDQCVGFILLHCLSVRWINSQWPKANPKFIFFSSVTPSVVLWMRTLHSIIVRPLVDVINDLCVCVYNVRSEINQLPVTLIFITLIFFSIAFIANQIGRLFFNLVDEVFLRQTEIKHRFFSSYEADTCQRVNMCNFQFSLSHFSDTSLVSAFIVVAVSGVSTFDWTLM